MANSLFSRQSLSVKATVIALILALVFNIIDSQKPELTKPIRSLVHASMSPLYGIAEKVRYTQTHINIPFTSKTSLYRENEILKTELAQANAYLQKYAVLSAENARLRGLLNAPTPVDGRTDIAAVIGIDNNPLRQILVLNRGKKHGVYVGQTVLDEAGIMGQIINVYGATSRAMLLSDTQHSIAVKVKRTGVRAIVTGNGDNDGLELQYLPNTADLQVGDKIISSGLGERFPAGYMIGEVSYIDHMNKHEFIYAKVKPSASLHDDRYVMLLNLNQKIQLTPTRINQDDATIFNDDVLLEADFAADHQSNTSKPQTP